MICGKTVGLHVIQFPTKVYGFVGSIPTILGNEVPATKSDIMGQRAHRNNQNELVTWKFPTFASKELAVDYAKTKGCIVE